MCAECNQYDAVPVSNDLPMLDCTMCRKCLPCKKASKKLDDIICEEFDNICSDDEEPLEDATGDDTDTPDVVVCSGACEACGDCPNGIPHEPDENMDKSDICDTVGFLVTSKKI